MAGAKTTTTTPPAPRTRPVGPEHVRRALALVDAHTTDMADSILTVPLSYYRDPTQAERERQLLRRTPLALAPTAQLPHPNDFVVRDVLGTSVLLTRDAEGNAHAFLNYCRHRGGKPATAPPRNPLTAAGGAGTRTSRSFAPSASLRGSLGIWTGTLGDTRAATSLLFPGG